MQAENGDVSWIAVLVAVAVTPSPRVGDVVVHPPRRDPHTFLAGEAGL